MKKLKKKNNKLFTTIVVSVIMVLIKSVLTFMSASICTITFYQPSEPENIKYYERTAVL